MTAIVTCIKKRVLRTSTCIAIVSVVTVTDGSFVGFMGGAVSVSEFMYDLSQTDAQEEAALVEPLFKNNADMGYDGDECDLFSMAFQFEGTKAFVIREETEE